MTEKKPSVAIVGGTGVLGSAMAGRLVKSGWTVVVGSRTEDKARSAAETLGTGPGANKPTGLANIDAAAAADVVIVTVPFASQDAILMDIAPSVVGKLIVDTTVPLVPPKVARVQLPDEGSAALRAQKLLGDGCRVVSGFHNVAAHKLAERGDVDCDVLIFGDAPEDRDVAVCIAEAMGLRGIHAGPLANSVAAEALTSVLIGVNRRYKSEGSGIRITGLGEP